MKSALIALSAMVAAPVSAGSSQVPPDLSVMTYNVHGLPWPIALGRTRALRAIGARLADMRLHADQPHVVLLQEAFSGDAKSIAIEAKYPFVVNGPSRDDRSFLPPSPTERAFTRADRPLKGEGDGKFEDSGLLVLSDYPILDVKRVPYAQYACAGYDCLANKGIVLVRVDVPGAAQPITIVDTHMNSRGACGVAHSRADVAYGWQAEQLRAFIAGNVPLTVPAIVAGDFNIGKIGYRLAMITGSGGILPGAGDALREALTNGLEVGDESAARQIVSHGKDWMFARSGRLTKLTLKGIAVPFGVNANGKSLSDHFGYVAHYRVSQAGQANS